jgi:hypothetical protein
MEVPSILRPEPSVHYCETKLKVVLGVDDGRRAANGDQRIPNREKHAPAI